MRNYERESGFTRVDAAVALACIALVLAQAGMINAGGRERAKREVCLANLMSLTAAWQMYAQDNSGKLVNGGQPPSNIPAPTSHIGAHLLAHLLTRDMIGARQQQHQVAQWFYRMSRG